MGIKEDRDDFNNSGWRAVLRRMMTEKDEGFIKLHDAGWMGDEVSERPTPGSGPFLHYRRGYPLIRYENSTTEDVRQSVERGLL